MRYADALELDDESFRRLTGVKKPTFRKRLDSLTEAHARKKARGGRPHKLQAPERMLRTLEYLREYRTYFPIAARYGLAESNAFAILRGVEDTLIQSGLFSLPGKKALAGTAAEREVLGVDATETPVERPKKSNAGTTRAQRSAPR